MHDKRTVVPAGGWTLVEFMLATALVGVLVAIGLPVYQRNIERARVEQARADLLAIRAGVLLARGPNLKLPDTLGSVPQVPTLDPWGHPYIYLYFGTPGVNRGSVRKDRNLVPINSEFDLYSSGKDGRSVPPLTARPSLDDIVVGRDGAFVGLAKDF
ncbi:MAG TPA: hypothetical protein VKO83_06955 [Steroidobacteraceae bacterium]|nr:hypothetical protein [Steroidobacteraceae bacterium]